MNYKESCAKMVNSYKSIIEELANARDKFEHKSSEHKYFQGLIDSVGSIKSALEADFMESQINELKNKQ